MGDGREERNGSNEAGRSEGVAAASALPGRSRDIVALGFVKGVAVRDRTRWVEFTPDTINVAKVLSMEQGIREVLRKARFESIELETEPLDDDDIAMLLGGASTNPLQIDLSDSTGLSRLPTSSRARGARAKNLLSPEPPKDGNPAQAADGVDGIRALPSEAPQGNSDPSYDGPLPVFQWQRVRSSLHGLEAEASKRKPSIGNCNSAVCCWFIRRRSPVDVSLEARHWIS